MLDQDRANAALHAKRDSFLGYQQRGGQEACHYGEALDWMAGQTANELQFALSAIARPGARPTSERLRGRPFVIPFLQRWANHRDAREWAMRVLGGVTTLAVDGSQITPSRDLSIPVGAVQVGWFENPHRQEARYVKDIRFQVLGPDEVAGDEAQEGAFPDAHVNLRRFECECDVLTEHMQRLAGTNPAPVCFLDGSLIVSFAAQMRAELGAAYLSAVVRLREASEATCVPLVGYVDTSYANDLVSMLRWLLADTKATALSDGALLRTRMSWGDRTEALACARDDRLAERSAQAQSHYGRVHIVYLQTTARNAPARLELPAWILEAGQLEHVLDVVRAECVVGVGYPYAVETADALAVITMQDRERFYRVFQEFAHRLGMDLRVARKALSKRARR